MHSAECRPAEFTAGESTNFRFGFVCSQHDPNQQELQ